MERTKTEQSQNLDEIFKEIEDEMYRKKLNESTSMRSKTIDLIITTLYEKNDREMSHSKRVSYLCATLAKVMKFDVDSVKQMETAGLMHDIGKIGIEESIINKPNKLNEDEWDKVKRHSEIGYRILSSVNEFSEIAEYILQHHERYDGKGYPKGLSGEEISLQARIICIVDAYDAMTCSRPYKKSLTNEEAISELEKHAGTQFDPVIAKLFIEEIASNEKHNKKFILNKMEPIKETL